MKYLTLCVYIILCISMVSLASAITEYVQLDFNNHTTNSGNDDATFAWTGSAGYVTGQNGSAADINALTEYIRSSNLALNTEGFGAGDNFTIINWFNPSSTADGKAVWAMGSSATDLAVETSGGDVQFYNDATYTKLYDTVAGTWNHIAIVHDAQDNIFELYVNGTWISNVTDSSYNNNGGGVITLGANRLGGNGANGYYEDFRMYNYSLTPAEISFIYNNPEVPVEEAGGGGGPSGATNVLLNTPVDNFHTNDNTPTISYNYSTSVTPPEATCNLYFNDSAYGVNTSVVNGTYYLEANATLSDGGYSYYVNCVNADNNTNSTSKTIVIDTVNPTINVNQPAGVITNNFNLDIDINDTYLFAYNVTIFQPSGAVIYNNWTQNLTVNSYVIGDYIDTTNWLDGNYTYNVTVSDDHTAKTIPDYNVDNTKKSKITFKTPNDNNIKIETRDSSDITATKLVDRYSFTMDFDDGLTATRVFDVKSDYPLYYRDFTGYKAHFVTFGGGAGNWIDFEGVGGLATVNRIDDYHYTVTIANVPPIATFNSIGGLNTESSTGSFIFNGTWEQYNFTAKEIYSKVGINNFTLNISGQTNVTTSGVAELILNTSKSYDITFTNSLGYNNYTFNILSGASNPYNINIYNSNLTILGYNYSGGNLSNLSINLTYNGTVYNFFNADNQIVLNLTAGLNYSINLTSRPDFVTDHGTNKKYVNASVGSETINYTLFHDNSIWFYPVDLLSSAALSNVNVTLSGATTYIYNDINLSMFRYGINTGSYSLLAEKTNYNPFLQTISIVEGSFVNVTAQMSQDANDVTFIVQNVYNQLISGASVSIIRQSDNSLVASDTTDFSGEVQFNLNELLDYYINITATGYVNFFDTLNVIESQYVITLQLTPTQNNFYEGITYEFKPSHNTILVNQTIQDFTFNFTNTGDYEVTSCFFWLYNGTNLLTTNTSYCSVSNGFVTNTFNTSNYTNIRARATLTLNSTTNITFEAYYPISTYYQGTFSLKSLLDRISNFDKAGFSGFGRYILATIIIISLTVLMVSKTSVLTSANGSKVLLFITALTGIFSYIGWLQIRHTSELVSNQYFTFVILTVLTIAYIISEEVKG